MCRRTKTSSETQGQIVGIRESLNGRKNIYGTKKSKERRSFLFFVSHDVTAAILVSQNNETAAMLVSQTNTVGVELFSYANVFFCSNEFA